MIKQFLTKSETKLKTGRRVGSELSPKTLVRIEPTPLHVYCTKEDVWVQNIFRRDQHGIIAKYRIKDSNIPTWMGEGSNVRL